MAGLLDFFSGGSDADLYGGLLNEAQRSALATRGLAAMAEKFGQLAMPQRAPIPLGAILGQGFGAYGAGTDEAVKTAFEGQYKAAQAKKLQSEIEYAAQSGPYFDKIIAALAGLGGPGGGGPLAAGGSGSTGGAAVSPGAGGSGGGGDGADISDPLALIEKYESGGRNIMQGVVPPGGGYNPSVGRVTGPSSAGGYWQIIDPTWRENAPKVGVDLAKYPTAISAPREVQKAVAQKLYDEQGFAPWAPYNPALAAAIRRGGGAGAPAAAAPAPAGGGGLLNLPQVPNAARDYFGATAAPDTPTPADVAPNRVGRFAGVAPGTPVNSRGFPYNPEITDPAVAARVAQSMAAIRQAQQSGVPWAAPRETGGGGTPGQGAALEEPPGFAGRQLVAQLGAGAPLDDLSQYRQVAGPGGGDAPGGMVSGLLVPGGPLSRGGVPGLPAMPAAAPPSADPSLQLGPLAPAPTAAAPVAAPAAAPGPGLLAPGALPGTAAPTPRGVNPAYGQVATAIAAAALQASRAGMPTAPFTALLEALKSNPAYQAEVKRGEKGVELEYAPAMAEATKAVELRYAQAIAAQTAAGNLPSQIILKNVEAQNDLRNRMATLGLEVTFDKDGNGTTRQMQDAAEAMGAVEAAKPTPEMKNYNAYVKDAQMRNQPVLSQIDWERTRSQPDPERAARIALDLKVAEPLAAQAAAGVQAKPLLDEMVRLAYQTPEGMAGEGSAAAGKLMAAFGFAPTDRMSNAELLTGLQQRLIGPIREPGTSSDRDVSRYLLATPGLMSTGDGRVKMAEMTKALIDRNNELATVYRNNLGSPDLQQKLTAIHNKPLFSDEQRAAIDETIRTRGGTVPGGVTPGGLVPPATAPPGTPSAPRRWNPAANGGRGGLE